MLECLALAFAIGVKNKEVMARHDATLPYPLLHSRKGHSRKGPRKWVCYVALVQGGEPPVRRKLSGGASIYGVRYSADPVLATDARTGDEAWSGLQGLRGGIWQIHTSGNG